MDTKSANGTYMPYAVPIWCEGMTCETKGHNALASIEYDIPITTYNCQHTIIRHSFIAKATGYCNVQTAESVRYAKDVLHVTLRVTECNEQVF